MGKNESNTNSKEKDEPEIIGISCSTNSNNDGNNGCRWDIKTYHSNSMSNEYEIESLTKILQDSAKPNNKKIIPPEIVFLNNSLVVSCNSNINFSKEVDDDDDGDNNKIIEITFNAESALIEWAIAHRGLILNENDTNDNGDDDNNNNEENNSCCRGVSVLETKDAKLWKQKRKLKQQLATNSNSTIVDSSSCFNPNLIIKTKNEFHFDWSYSTPYTGTILLNHPSLSSSSSSSLWMKRDNSGINKQLLLDQTKPILFYDNIILYEDDLHDNGEVSLSIKIRVMPNCFYILQRLYVRVDYVLVRCRDVRIFYEFDSDGSGSSEIMRDVTWKEIKWDDMGKLGLSKDVCSWMENNVKEYVWERVPFVDLPHDIPKYSSLSINY